MRYWPHSYRITIWQYVQGIMALLLLGSDNLPQVLDPVVPDVLAEVGAEILDCLPLEMYTCIHEKHLA